MKTNKKKNIAVLLAAAFLFIAQLYEWPYGFFTLLRIVVAATTAFVAWLAYSEGKKWWALAFVCIAILFNPIILIHFDREIWQVIDVILALFMIVSAFVLKLDKIRTQEAAVKSPPTE